MPAVIRVIQQLLAVAPGETWDELPLQQRLLVDQVAVKGAVVGVLAESPGAAGITYQA